MSLASGSFGDAGIGGDGYPAASDGESCSRTRTAHHEAHNIEEECLNHVSVNVTPFSIPHEVYNKLLPELQEVKTEKQLDKLLESIEASLKAQLEQVRKIAETTGLSVMQAEDKERTERYLETYELRQILDRDFAYDRPFVRNPITRHSLSLRPSFCKLVSRHTQRIKGSDQNPCTGRHDDKCLLLFQNILHLTPIKSMLHTYEGHEHYHLPTCTNSSFHM